MCEVLDIQGVVLYLGNMVAFTLYESMNYYPYTYILKSRLRVG